MRKINPRSAMLAITRRSLTTEVRSSHRRPELDFFSKYLQLPPSEIMVLLGPPGTGKTTLLQEVLTQLNNPICRIDLRQTDFTSPSAFYFAIKHQWRNGLTRSLSPDIAPGFVSEDPSRSINHLFAATSQILNCNRWEHPPVLWVDQAHKMANLLDHPEGAIVLRNFLDWTIAISKQNHQVHIIFSSHASFFDTWISDYLYPNYVSHVLGDLSKPEAERYWNEISRRNVPEFQEVWPLGGGRMMVLDRYAAESDLFQGKITPETFSLTRQEMARIHRGFNSPKYSAMKLNRYPASPPAWNGTQWHDTMKQLATSTGGWISYEILANSIGKRALDSLIQHNLLYLRPPSNLSDDIPDAPNESIVTPVTPTALWVMRNFSNLLPS